MSQLEYQWLAEIAEGEVKTPRIETEFMSPSVYYESAPLFPGKIGGPSCSPALSAGSPSSPTKIFIGLNERPGRLNKPFQPELMPPNEIDGVLHHPFITTTLFSSKIEEPPRSPSECSLDPAYDGRSKQNLEPRPDESHQHEYIQLTSLDPSIGGANDCGPISKAELKLSKPFHMPKRSRAFALLENDDGAAKRHCLQRNIHGTPVSPEPCQDHQPTFSTASTIVNTETGSSYISGYTDYSQIIKIIMYSDGRPVVYICHEHKLLQVSGLVQEFRCTHREKEIILHPQHKLPNIKLQTIHYFLHWLYNDRFTESKNDSCSFSQLLDLYFLGHAYAIAVLKNVVIDHLIEKGSVFRIPAHCTKRIYRFTERDDQLRRLWVDIYVWEVTEDQLRSEMISGKLDPTFLQEMALAQMNKIRTIQESRGLEAPPYEKASSAYHKPDPSTGLFDRPKQFGREDYQFGGQKRRYIILKDKLKQQELELTRLKRRQAKNANLKRRLRKVQLNLSKKRERLINNHISVKHRKLMRADTFDYPDIQHPELMKRRKSKARSQSRLKA